MNKNQLIKKLEKIPGDPIILMASDSEGNSYDTLDEIYTGENNDLRYRQEDYEINLISKEDIDDEYFTEKDYNKAKHCIVFFP